MRILIFAILLFSCRKKEVKPALFLTEAVRRVEPISTSFNESSKTAIQTERVFFVVQGFPMVGDSVTVVIRGGIREMMLDARGIPYVIL